VKQGAVVGRVVREARNEVEKGAVVIGLPQALGALEEAAQGIALGGFGGDSVAGIIFTSVKEKETKVEKELREWRNEASARWREVAVTKLMAVPVRFSCAFMRLYAPFLYD
jgi:hypothetical protein